MSTQTFPLFEFFCQAPRFYAGTLAQHRVLGLVAPESVETSPPGSRNGCVPFSMRLRIDRNAVRVHLSQHKSRYCPCRSGARQRRNVDTADRDEEERIKSKHVPCIPSSAITEPAPDMPELELPGQDHGERHSEHKAHAKAYNDDQKDRAQTATVSMYWERNSEIPYPQQRQHTQTQYTFLSNPHCSAPFICRTFTTVFYSAASKNQPGFLRNLGASFRIRVHRRDRQS